MLMGMTTKSRPLVEVNPDAKPPTGINWGRAIAS